ncbi:MAG: glycoside hydrolase family 38 C-terminal domain-containing protein [bacterium]
MGGRTNRIKKVFAIPHFHYDVEWWKTEDRYNEDVAAILARAVELLDKHPEFTYAIDQALALRPFWNAHPEVQDKIKRWVAEGRIELVGGRFCSPDENIPTGEALARQYVYGKRFFEDVVGGRVKTAWEIDVFGHPAQFAQIVKRCGVNQYVFARGVQNWRDPKAPAHFYFESPDGSRVLCNWFSAHYIGFAPLTEEMINSKSFKNELMSRVDYETPRTNASSLMFPFGTDFGIPFEKWVYLVREWNEKSGYPQVEFSLPDKFFEELRAESGDDLPVIKTELNPLLTGCYESRERVKKLCRRTQHGILDAEKWAAAAWSRGLMDYPSESLDVAWENILENDFHDIICGTGTDKVYRNTLKRYSIATNKIKEVGDAAREKLAALADTRGGGSSFVAFNSLNWPRRELIRIPMDSLGDAKSGEFVATGPAGEPLCCQRAGDVLLVPADMPAVGFAVFNIKNAASVPAKEKPKAPKLSVNGLTAENAFLRITMDAKTGSVASIYDKEAGCETLDASRWQGNEILVEEDAGNLWTVQKTGRTWEGKNYRSKVKLIERGPLRVCFESRGEHKEMACVRRVYLVADSRRIEFETIIDFHGKDRRVKAMFAPSISGKPVFETPFYAQPREAGHWCAQTWADISNGRRGLAVLNDGNPGMDADNDSLGLVLFRSLSVLSPAYLRYVAQNFVDIMKCSNEAASLVKRGLGIGEWALYKHHGITLREWSSEGGPNIGGGITLPDHLVPFLLCMKQSDAWERGRHEFRYAVYAHAGDWREARLPMRGQEFNTPAAVVAAPKRNGALGRAASLITTGEADAAILVALKKAEKSDKLVARIYDSLGRGADVALKPADAQVKSCRKINITEDDKGSAVKIKSGAAADHVAPWQIMTYAMELAKK